MQKPLRITITALLGVLALAVGMALASSPASAAETYTYRIHYSGQKDLSLAFANGDFITAPPSVIGSGDSATFTTSSRTGLVEYGFYFPNGQGDSYIFARIDLSTASTCGLQYGIHCGSVSSGNGSWLYVLTLADFKYTIPVANANDWGVWRDLVGACANDILKNCTKRSDWTWRIPLDINFFELDSALQHVSVPPASLGYPYSASLNTHQANAPGWVVQVDNLPAGLWYTQETDTISGTPLGDTPTTAALSVFLKTADGRVLSAKTVELQLNYGPPEIVTSSFPTASSQVYYQRGVQVSSKDESPVTLSVTGLPQGFTFESSSGAIIGVPTQAGTFPIEIKATNRYGTTTKIVPLTVVWSAPRFLTTVLGQGTVGKVYSQWVVFDRQGAPSDATSWVATGLPPGLSYQPFGIYGTPTRAGTFAVRMTATTVGGGTTTKVLQLVIKPAS